MTAAPLIPRPGKPWSAAAAARRFVPTHAAHRLVEAYPILLVSPDFVVVEAWGEAHTLVVPPAMFWRGVPLAGDFIVRAAPTPGEPEGTLSWCRRDEFETAYRPLPPAAVADLDVVFDALRVRLVALGIDRAAPIALPFLAALRDRALALTAETRSPATPQGRADAEATPASGVA